MDSNPTSLLPAYILHYRDFRESSLIVDAFTLKHGCVSMVARGARGAKPAVRALYQPFRPLLLSWVGSEGLRTLTGIEESGKAYALVDAQLACAYYFNELLLRLLGKDQPQEVVFAHYALALSELADPGLSYEQVLRAFELQVLDAIGVLPDLSRCTKNGSYVQPDVNYLFHPANAVAVPVLAGEDYGLLKQKHRTGDSGGDPSMHPDGMTSDEGIPVSGRTLIALSQINLSELATLEEARPFMRRIIKNQIGEKPLKSRDLFRTLTPSRVGPQGSDPSNLLK